jgi:UDP-glucose 4-epimerase
MRVLITGGSGFIGSNLNRFFTDRGHQVYSMDVLREDDNFTTLIGDVRNYCRVTELVADADLVLHCASPVGVVNVTYNPMRTADVIVTGTVNVTKACVIHGVRLINFSTSEVYGDLGRAACETDNCILRTDSPRWVYASAKLTAEHVAQSWDRSTTVRLFNAAGPGQAQDMVIPRFITAARAGDPLQLYGGGGQTRCFTHIQDVCEAIYRLADTDASCGHVVNVGNPMNSTTMMKLAKLIIQKTGASLDQLYYALGREEGDIAFREPNIGKLRRLTGWQPPTSLDQILTDAVDSARSLSRAS